MLDVVPGASGFRTSFQIKLERILEPPPEATPKPGDPPAMIKTVAIPTVAAITPAFFDAEVTVVMSDPASASTFDLTIHGLNPASYDLIDPQNTIVHISLGYADTDVSEVLTGLVLEKSITAADCFYDVQLKGTEFVFDQLKHPRTPTGGMNYSTPNPDMTIGAIARDLCGKLNVRAQINPEGPTVKSLGFVNITPLVLLQELAKRAQQPEQPADVQLQVKDGWVFLGTPEKIGTDHSTSIDDGGLVKPVTASGSNAAAGPQDGQDFDIPGDPALRPNDTVTFADKKKYRIYSITHSLSGDSGYRCKGRALGPGAKPGDQHKAARPSAAQVARAIQDNMILRERRRPAVSAGEAVCPSAE